MTKPIIFVTIYQYDKPITITSYGLDFDLTSEEKSILANKVLKYAEEEAKKLKWKCCGSRREGN